MMGRRNHDQEQFFYSFRLDEAVPNDLLVRQIAAVRRRAQRHVHPSADEVRSAPTVRRSARIDSCA